MKRGASHLVDPLKKSAAPLGCGGVAVKGVLVALRGLKKGHGTVQGFTCMSVKMYAVALFRVATSAGAQ